MVINLRTVKLSTVASGEDYTGILGISVCAISSYSIRNNTSCDTEPSVVVVLDGHVGVSHLRESNSVSVECKLRGFEPGHMTIDSYMVNIWPGYKNTQGVAEYTRHAARFRENIVYERYRSTPGSHELWMRKKDLQNPLSAWSSRA